MAQEPDPVLDALVTRQVERLDAALVRYHLLEQQTEVLLAESKALGRLLRQFNESIVLVDRYTGDEDDEI